MAARGDQFVLTQVGKVLGNRDLAEGKNLLEMADTERAVKEEMKDAEARFITKTFENLDEIHS